LVLYLTRKLFYTDDDGEANLELGSLIISWYIPATIIYHTFNMLIYFTCIIGAVIADSWWGRFKTIWILSIVYSIGSVLIAIGAIELLNLPAR
jgi:dipeptide/tripeptide permease